MVLPEGARESLGVDLQIKLEDILAYSERHKKLEIGFRAAYELRDLPKYDDVSMYGVGKNLEASLVRLEAKRLIAAANAKEPLLFDSSGSLENADKDCFQNVANIADQLACNLSVAIHDNSLVKEPEEYKRKSLRSYEQHTRRLNRLSGDDRVGPENLKHRPPEKLAERNRELYFLVVNYVTAVIIRYLAACAASEQWLIITITVLAKQSMKLKVLEKDPSGFAKMSQEAEEDLNDEYEQHRYLSMMEKPTALSLHSDNEKSFELDQIYHFEEWYIRDTINYLFLYMLSAIGGGSQTADGGSCFEMSTRVYRTGISSSLLVISSDWDGEYSASSDPQRIRYCRAALDILLLNTRAIAKHKNHTRDLVHIHWDFEGPVDPRQRPLELQHQTCTKRQFAISSMDDALSMLMPLALCNAHAAIEAFCMLTTANIACVSAGKPRSREYIDEHFSAKFSFTTEAYKNAQQKIGPSPGYKSLRDANSLEEHLVPGCSLESTEDRDWPKFEKQMDAASEWKLDETCVIVECGRYVWTIMGIALFIVIGGLAVPFSSHVRLEGVDPFNITTFVWLLVAFFVLIAKSRYVPNWAWHDFLHRRIICRTVTELANVTAMDPQLVIHKLLVSENSSVLGTRGPHNSMFKLQRPNGFSIDVPVKTPTLYASGFVLFRCLGKVDQHIICLDARPIDLTTTSLLVAEHRPSQKSFGCRLPSPNSGMKPYMDVLKLTEREYEGDRILGLFLADAEFG